MLLKRKYSTNLSLWVLEVWNFTSEMDQGWAGPSDHSGQLGTSTLVCNSVVMFGKHQLEQL